METRRDDFSASYSYNRWRLEFGVAIAEKLSVYRVASVRIDIIYLVDVVIFCTSERLITINRDALDMPPRKLVIRRFTIILVVAIISSAFGV